MAEHDFWQWPALRQAEQPQALEYERGIWGKAQGARSDFRWLAATEGFALRHTGAEKELSLGSEDLPQKTQCWRALGDTYYAVACYKSRAQDAAGRGNFLEKQIIEWRPSGPAIPAALGALLLLPEAASYSDALWWERRDEGQWEKAAFVLPLDRQCCPPLSLDDLGARLQASIQALIKAVPIEALEQFYAAVLGGRAATLPGLGQALPAQALAALWLPLERGLADRFSLVNWLPSQRANLSDLRTRWGAVLGGSRDFSKNPPQPTEEQRLLSEQMAEALYKADPTRIGWRPAAWGQPSPSPEAEDLQLAIWGPSSAGKTVLMAQLYLENFDKGEEWQISANKASLAFIEGMKLARGDNRFPAATAHDQVDQLRYQFFNRATQAKASLLVEDRAGAHYQELKDTNILNGLIAADGLVLLIDPLREAAGLEDELSKLFTYMQADRQPAHPQDLRPIAVCLSKADDLIEHPKDLRNALEQPDDFVKTRDSWGLAPLLDRYCANYRLFPVSAVGVALCHGTAESNTCYDENLILRVKSKSQSFNLLEPFEWLIQQLRPAQP
jgi:hypothetical protein